MTDLEKSQVTVVKLSLKDLCLREIKFESDDETNKFYKYVRYMMGYDDEVDKEIVNIQIPDNWRSLYKHIEMVFEEEIQKVAHQETTEL